MQQYALPVEQVLEVAAMVIVTTLSDTPPEMLGLANRHGEVLHILDLRKVFKLPAAPINASTLFIVAEVGHKRVGLVVDEVYQVKYILDEAYRPTQGAGHTITHIVGDGESLFQLIDVAPILATYLPGR